MVPSQGCLVSPGGTISVFVTPPNLKGSWQFPRTGSLLSLRYKPVTINPCPNKNSQAGYGIRKALANFMEKPLSAMPDMYYELAPNTSCRIWFNLQEYPVKDQSCHIERAGDGVKGLIILEQSSFIVNNKVLVLVKSKSHLPIQVPLRLCVAVKIPESMPKKANNQWVAANNKANQPMQVQPRPCVGLRGLANAASELTGGVQVTKTTCTVIRHVIV